MNEKDASFLVLFLAPVKDYLADDKVSAGEVESIKSLLDEMPEEK